MDGHFWPSNTCFRKMCRQVLSHARSRVRGSHAARPMSSRIPSRAMRVHQRDRAKVRLRFASLKLRSSRVALMVSARLHHAEPSGRSKWLASRSSRPTARPRRRLRWAALRLTRNDRSALKRAWCYANQCKMMHAHCMAIYEKAEICSSHSCASAIG